MSGSGPIRLRRVGEADAVACAALFEGLPTFFTPDVPAKVVDDVATHGAWVLDDGGLLAVAVVARRGPGAAEVLWLAVVAGRHREGLGGRLLRHVLDALRRDGVVLVEAKTLDAAAGYAPYEATRAFWASQGFVQVDTIDPLPDWPPGNPAAILVASLAATRP